jgi:hypothetical protein
MTMSKEHRQALEEALDDTDWADTGDVYVYNVKSVELLRSAVAAMLEDDEA